MNIVSSLRIVKLSGMKKSISIIGLLLFIVMIYFNYLSGIGAINNISAGDVSNKYPTLFTPAGFTFSIWGIIYLFGFLFVIRLLWVASRKNSITEVNQLSLYYSLSCIINTFWLFSWHYDILWLSELLMLSLLLILILLYQKISKSNIQSTGVFLVTSAPISIYLGWITVATVANTSVWLTSMGWFGQPFPESFWAGTMVIIAAAISFMVLVKKRDYFFGMVYLWAAYGIMIARINDPVPGSIWIVRIILVGMILVFIGILYARFVRVRKV